MSSIYETEIETNQNRNSPGKQPDVVFLFSVYRYQVKVETYSLSGPLPAHEQKVNRANPNQQQHYFHCHLTPGLLMESRPEHLFSAD